MRKCKDCKKEKEVTEFYGIQGECKECTRKRVTARRLENPEKIRTYEQERAQRPERKKQQVEYQKRRRLKYPNKTKARNKISNGLRDGKVEKSPCEVCGDEKSEAHHPDYRSPLNVHWLCRKHHLEIEGKKHYEPET